MFQSSAYRVLVVDDDADLRASLQQRLQAEGLSVEVAGDGRQGLERALAGAPHLVVLDHYMPGMTGRELCARLRASGSGARLILLTSARRLEERVAGLDAGADDYVCKPFSFDELLARVRAQLRSVGPIDAAPSTAQAAVEDLRSADAGVRAAAAKRVRDLGGGLEFRVLGDFQVRWRGVELSSVLWNRRKPRLLLKHLLLRYGRSVAAEMLMEAVWPESDAETTRSVLHVNIQRLRRPLEPFGADRIRTTREGYAFHLLPDDTLDLGEFEALSRELGECLARRRDDVTQAAVLRLVALYRDDLLGEEAYSDPISVERERLRGAYLTLLGGLARHYRGRDELDSACFLYGRLLELNPLDEARAVDLAECLIQTRDPVGAVGVLRRAERRLAEEIEVAPGSRFRSLMARLDALLHG